MNTQLVQLSGQKAFTTSLIIASSCPTERKNKITGAIEEHERTNKSILALIDKHIHHFESHGKLDFENLVNKSGEPTRYAILNEDQATFLVTLFTNTEKVVLFKSNLVKAFRKAIDEINRLYANPPRTEIIAAKRAAHDPMMLALSDYRADLGKITGRNHYMCENKLCNSVVIGSFSAIDEKSLTNSDAELLRQVRAMNENLIKAGIEYSERKKMLTGFGIRYKTKLISHDNGA